YPEGLCPGWSIVVKGTSLQQLSITSFSLCLNLLCDPGDQIVLHFNPRFSSFRIVHNSFLANHCRKEEVNNTFPFEAKELFQVTWCHPMGLLEAIFTDEYKILQYKHCQRQPSTITTLQILNDITVSSVQLTRQPL
ncbi:GRIFN protein, partial [Rhinopomastus cyanomelas]|nr:GRIFN protein [Rhinopomastus cyanomelas]